MKRHLPSEDVNDKASRVRFISAFSPYFRCIRLLVVTILSHPYKLPNGLGRNEGRESCVLQNTTQPSSLLLNTARIQPGSQQHQSVGGNTVPLATWAACTAPGPPQESLVRDETRISLQAKNPPLPGRREANCTQPHGPPGRGRLRQSLGSNAESLVAQLALP